LQDTIVADKQLLNDLVKVTLDEENEVVKYAVVGCLSFNNKELTIFMSDRIIKCNIIATVDNCLILSDIVGVI